MRRNAARAMRVRYHKVAPFIRSLRKSRRNHIVRITFSRAFSHSEGPPASRYLDAPYFRPPFNAEDGSTVT